MSSDRSKPTELSIFDCRFSIAKAASLSSNMDTSVKCKSKIENPKSDRLWPSFSRPDANTVLQRQDENLAVADPAFRTGSASLHDGVDGRLDEVFVDGDLELHLAEQLHSQFVTAVGFGMAFLPAETLHVHDRETEDLDLV